METVICNCLKCKSELGHFRNSWNGIGNTYFSPVHRPLSLGGFEGTGNVYEAAPGSQIEDSLLQDLACANCQHVVGLRCDSAPDGHLLRQNQVILRLVDMSVVSEETGAKAKISIMKTIPLTLGGTRAKKLAASRKSSSVQPMSQPRPPRLLPGMMRASSVASRPSVPPPQDPQPETTKSKAGTEDVLRQQQMDIDRISGTVNRIERDMIFFKDFMEEVRADLATTRQATNRVSQDNLSSVRAEITELRQLLDSNQARTASRAASELSRRNLEVIVQDVQLVSQKVDEIDHMKNELELLRTRLGSLEAQKIIQPANISQNTEQARPGRKRKHSQINNDSPSLLVNTPASPELPATRRRTRNMTANEMNSQTANINSDPPRPPVTTRSQPVVQVLDSGSHFPAHDQDEERDELNFINDDDDTDGEYRPQVPATPVSKLTNSRTWMPGSTPLPNQASLPISERILQLKSVIEPDNYMRQKDLNLGRTRASNGVLITKSGKPDRRSLRCVSLLMGNEENQTPTRWSVAPDVLRPGASGIDIQQIQSPLQLPVLPSVEQFDASLGSLPTPRSSTPSLAITPRDPKPFKCGTCKKSYVAKHGLDYHSKTAKNAGCRKGVGNIVPEGFTCELCGKTLTQMQRLDTHRCVGELTQRITLEDRERGLAHREATIAAFEFSLVDRERIVRETLEREMSLAL